MRIQHHPHRHARNPVGHLYRWHLSEKQLAAHQLPVIVDLNGQLGTAASSERFKKDIKPMDKASEAILASSR